MALIPNDELTILKPASELLAVSVSAEADAQLKSIAYQLNSAANTGETSIQHEGRLLDEVVKKLKEHGYALTVKHAGGIGYIISFAKEG